MNNILLGNDTLRIHNLLHTFGEFPAHIIRVVQENYPDGRGIKLL
jgi:hypothetical protein